MFVGVHGIRLLCDVFDVLALVVLAREIVTEFGLAVEPELIRPGRMSVVRHYINAYLRGS